MAAFFLAAIFAVPTASARSSTSESLKNKSSSIMARPDFLNSPVAKAIQNAVKSGVQMGTGDTPWGPYILKNFSEESPLFAGVILDVKRDIAPNLKPGSSREQYIVSDIMKIGLRLGVGEHVGGDVTARVTFTLTYTAPTYEAALNANREIINWNLPFDILKDRLPRDENGRLNFVLSRDVDLEGRGWVRSDAIESTAPVGAEASVGRVKLARTLIDARSKYDSILVHEDRSLYTNIAYKAYFRVLSMLYINFVEGDFKVNGRLDGRTFEIANLKDEKIGQALQRVLLQGNYRDLSAMSKPLEETSAAFGASRFRMSLPLLASLEIRKTRADIKVIDENGATLKDLFQNNYSKKSRWAFMNSSEDSMMKISVQTPKSGVSSAAGAWSAELSFAMLDKNTRSGELESYLNFVSAFSPDGADSRLKFSHNVPNKTQDVFVSFGYCEKGIKNIFALTPEKFNAALAQVLGMDVRRLEYFANLYQNRLKDHTRLSQVAIELGRENSKLTEVMLFFHASVLREIARLQNLQTQLTQIKSLDAQRAIVVRTQLLEAQSTALLKIFRLLAFRGPQIYETDMLRALNLVAGAENVEVVAQLAPGTVQERYEAQTQSQVVTQRSGAACLNAGEAVVLFPMDGVEQYNALNWVREIQANSAKTMGARKPSSIWQGALWWEKARSFFLNIL